jgi:quinol monooxygenase YgiN
MVKGVWTFEVAEEKQEEYLRKTVEIIKPFWEEHECSSYEVYQDYTDPRRFVKEQYYPDTETMERSLSIAKTDPMAKDIIALFGQYATGIIRRRCVPRIDKNGLVLG